MYYPLHNLIELSNRVVMLLCIRIAIIRFAKFNLQIFYLLPYPREVWHYKDANTNLIRRAAVTDFKWERAFANTDINQKVEIFSKTIPNIFSNFVPREKIMCDDKDPP